MVNVSLVLGVHAHLERLIWRFAAPPGNTLRTDSQLATNGMPLRVDSIPLERGIAIDIPDHASVMVHRDANVKNLRRNCGRRCHRYVLEAVRLGFWKSRIWFRTFQSLIFLHLS